MSELITLSAAALAERLQSGEVSSVEATQAHLDRIAEVDGDIRAFLHVSADALKIAAEVDGARRLGAKLSPLAGVPVAIKDVLCTQDMPSTAGSRILEGWIPPYDATVVSRLRKARLVPLGKTNMDEFAMGSSTEHSAFGPTHNPWDLERIPGGSGGGSAAAVAAFEAPLALGSDTGGSIRQPASVTGTVGMKPTYGGVSRYGAIALASSLDQVGPVTRTVLDAALLHDVIGGHDPHDSTSLADAWPSFADAARAGAASGSLKGVRVGVVKELGGEGFQAGVSARFAEALEVMAAAGAEIVEVSAPSFSYAIAAYYLILPAEASSNLAKFDSVRFGLRVNPTGGGTVEEVMAATREAGFGPEVKRRIILGTYALSAGYYDAYYGSAQKVRTLIQRDFDAAFEKVDVLVSPAAPTTAFRLGEKLEDPLAMYLNDVTTIPANLAGVPGMGLPMGLAPEDGLPTGIQLMAPAREDARIYTVGATLEALLEQSWGHTLMSQAPKLRSSPVEPRASQVGPRASQVGPRTSPVGSASSPVGSASSPVGSASSPVGSASSPVEPAETPAAPEGGSR
ncbi:Asp-tRNA(Asn)/Glu-tRNA(Gln) amidotransferase subunit GatA [Leifsonia bigeumensis]|uniref:Glutamyl-tRNA(Gln) amidotransferase subunit A n=1 Tax=Leifsonella bigeumensis TaxID=433643 RepID=A0ABP7FIE7_9MICO